MQYLMLIYSAESCDPHPGTAEGDKFMGDYFAYTEQVKTNGMMLGSNALQPVSTATTVRVRKGKAETTDGPFAETKEQLGGYSRMPLSPPLNIGPQADCPRVHAPGCSRRRGARRSIGFVATRVSSPAAGR